MRFDGYVAGATVFAAGNLAYAAMIATRFNLSDLKPLPSGRSFAVAIAAAGTAAALPTIVAALWDRRPTSGPIALRDAVTAATRTCLFSLGRALEARDATAAGDLLGLDEPLSGSDLTHLSDIVRDTASVGDGSLEMPGVWVMGIGMLTTAATIAPFLKSELPANLVDAIAPQLPWVLTAAAASIACRAATQTKARRATTATRAAFAVATAGVGYACVIPLKRQREAGLEASPSAAASIFGGIFGGGEKQTNDDSGSPTPLAVAWLWILPGLAMAITAASAARLTATRGRRPNSNLLATAAGAGSCIAMLAAFSEFESGTDRFFPRYAAAVTATHVGIFSAYRAASLAFATDRTTCTGGPLNPVLRCLATFGTFPALALGMNLANDDFTRKANSSAFLLLLGLHTVNAALRGHELEGDKTVEDSIFVPQRLAAASRTLLIYGTMWATAALTPGIPANAAFAMMCLGWLSIMDPRWAPGFVAWL